VLLAALLIALFDWRTGVMILGISQLAICIPLALTVRHRPEEAGLLPDGEPPAPSEAPASPLPPSSPSSAPGSGLGREEGLTIGQALHTRSFWLLVLAIVLVSVSFLAVIVHLIAYLDESAGFTEEGAAVIAMGIPFGSVLGRLSFGWLADYLSKRWLVAVAWALEGLGILIFAAVHSPWQAVVFLVVFAPAFGGAFPVLPALMAEYFGLRAFGGIQGLIWGVAMLASFTGPLFAGGVYDVIDSYRPAFLLLGLSALGAALTVAMIGRPPAWAMEAAGAPTP
jgi:sugar phosphate permease